VISQLLPLLCEIMACPFYLRWSFIILNNFDEFWRAYPGKKVAKPKCKGLVFRGFSSMFFSDGRLEERRGIRLLKRESCAGCEKCGFILDDLSEQVIIGSMIIPEIEHGKLYEVIVTNESRDWETGYVDDYDLEVVLLNQGVN